MEYSKYEMSEVSYPESPKKPYLNKQHTSLEVKQYVKDLEIYEEAMIVYKEKQAKYYEEENKLEKQFKKDALEECGLSKHSNKDKIFNYAWEQGHSNGYEEVFNVLSEIAELFEKEV